MKLSILCIALCLSSAFGADVDTDEAAYASYMTAKNADAKDAAKLALSERVTNVKQILDDVASLRMLYPTKSADAALLQWRIDLRSESDPGQRWVTYERLRSVHQRWEALKTKTGAATISAAVTAEKADIQAKR